MSAMITKDDYFLSAENPVATVDQRDLEELALRILKRPELQKARAMATVLWRNAVAYPAAEQMSRFDNMIDEFMFNFALRAINTDACYPKILRMMQPPHHWFGRDVPGSRWGGDSPDFTYRTIPIAHGGQYEIRGRPACDDPPTVTYTLMENLPALVTLGILDSQDIPTDRNGAFVITIDATPADGRKNHLQTRPGEFHHLLVRDAVGDWLTQTPNILRVRRLDDPGRAPLTEDELTQHMVKVAMDSLYYVYYSTRSGAGQPPNVVRVPGSAAPFGGMATQWGTKGNLDLAADEAFIATTNSAGAMFRNIVLCDLFFMSLNYWSRTGSFNTAQMAADEDGRFTFVVAHQDPGVHNWLDTGGLRQTIFGTRWQSFANGSASETPTISVRVVKFKDLERELPRGVRRIDATGRRQQIARREAGFRRRFIDS